MDDAKKEWKNTLFKYLANHPTVFIDDIHIDIVSGKALYYMSNGDVLENQPRKKTVKPPGE